MIKISRIRSLWRWTLCLSLLCPLQLAAAPAQEGETVIVDNAFKSLRPAIFRRPFQRIPDQGERPFWTDPTGESPELQFDPQRTIFGDEVLWIDPMTYGKVAMARAERMSAVAALVTPERLETAIRDAIARADGVAEGPASRIVFAREAGKAQVAQVLAGRDSGNAMVVQGPVFASHLPDPGAVQLSWDDRQVVITLRLQRFRKVRGKHMSIRDLGPLTFYHYVGAPVPEGVDPVAYWTRNDGAPLLAALREGFERIVRTARSPLPEGAPPAPGATSVVMVGDRLQQFPGTVIERGEGVALLRLAKAEFVLVATGTGE
ncbi:hypothetical protein [Lysobacter hankyongensis]|uniref:Uncharacterized protein n=1 Tax=Lysobacter hankyongensis TaxID=1176535 RepID=A0ABP9AW48_9GAMM